VLAFKHKESTMRKSYEQNAVLAKVKKHFGGYIPKATSKAVIAYNRRLVTYQANNRAAIVSELIVKKPDGNRFMVPIGFAAIH
jgi:hypothetical protein